MTTIEKLQQQILELDIEGKQRKKEMDELFRKSKIESDARGKEADARGKEADARLAKLEKFIDKETKDTKKLKEMIFGIGKNQGVVAEEFFQNSIKPTQKVGGVQYDMMNTNMKRNIKGLEGEYDIVLVNGKELAIIEVKYNAHQNDLDKFLNVQYPKFKKLYPEYNDYKHHLGLASFHIYDNVKEEALKNNVMVLQRKGDIVETFLPR